MQQQQAMFYGRKEVSALVHQPYRYMCLRYDKGNFIRATTCNYGNSLPYEVEPLKLYFQTMALVTTICLRYSINAELGQILNQTSSLHPAVVNVMLVGWSVLLFLLEEYG
ncbi:hypothetical protein TSUD_156400 [Trifolium subterraneum]|uniref:Uncharacterized protein n=1 Tax=Trifolium subterraneum TaxID=3900 RepID=A0A2Z6M185_TRISU|nr:hypothetical protein TSUD_156400 [Trifolium subterraneum]